MLFSCTPAPPVTIEYPEPVWKSYTHFKPHEVAREKARLERMLDTAGAEKSSAHQRNDSVDIQKPSRLDIMRRLFELSIHHANPDYDIQKIYEYVTFLYQFGGADSLRYLNWGRVVRDREALLRERDSLMNVLSNASDDGKKQSGLIAKLNQDKKECVQHLDSLNTIILMQQETIQKLQKLDVLMEQRRNKIP